MRNSYIVYGTRYSKFDEIYKWILNHQQAWLYKTDVETHRDGKYTKFQGGETEYFDLSEVHLVYNEDLMASRNNEYFRKSIIMLRDLTDVIEDVLHKTFKPAYVDSIIRNQIELFEEYTDEYINETNRCPDSLTLFILYDKWLTNIDYRNRIADKLGFVNSDNNIYEPIRDHKLRNKLRFKKHITDEVRKLNSRI